MPKFNIGDKVFIIENSIFIKEVIITKYAAGFYTIKRVKEHTAYRVRESRLYTSEFDAKKILNDK